MFISCLSIVVWSMLMNQGVGENPAPKPQPKPLTVADVITALGLEKADFTYLSEPPGKLRALKCKTRLRATESDVFITIEVVYTDALFSDTRKWDAKTVSAAKVIKVVITTEDKVD